MLARATPNRKNKMIFQFKIKNGPFCLFDALIPLPQLSTNWNQRLSLFLFLIHSEKTGSFFKKSISTQTREKVIAFTTTKTRRLPTTTTTYYIFLTTKFLFFFSSSFYYEQTIYREQPLSALGSHQIQNYRTHSPIVVPFFLFCTIFILKPHQKIEMKST